MNRIEFIPTVYTQMKETAFNNYIYSPNVKTIWKTHINLDTFLKQERTPSYIFHVMTEFSMWLNIVVKIKSGSNVCILTHRNTYVSL